MSNLATLKPPKKGEVRNPKGRGHTKNRSTILKKWLLTTTNVKDLETKEDIKVSCEDAISISLIRKAIAGDVLAIKEVNDTLYGKITDKTDLSNSDGSLIQKALPSVSISIRNYETD